jgi:hypothetical protein
MAPPHAYNALSKEGKMLIATNSIEKNQIKSIRDASRVFDVPFSTLQHRLQGTGPREGAQVKTRLLWPN